MQECMVKNFPPWRSLLVGFCLVYVAMYVWMHWLLNLALSKIHFIQGYWRCQLVHPQENAFGTLCIWKEYCSNPIFSSHLPVLLCAPTVLLFTVWICGGSITLMKIPFTPAPLLPIQPALCNRWALGPGCLSLIALLKQDQTRSMGGWLAVMWFWGVQQ